MPTGAWLYSYIFLWVLSLIELVVCILLVRQVSALVSHWVRNDPEWGLPLGSIAPVLPNTDIFDNQIPQFTDTNTYTTIFFLSTSCGACDELARKIPTISKIEGVLVIIVMEASIDNSQLFLVKHRIDENQTFRVIADPLNKVATAYRSQVHPFVVVVNPAGRIASKRTALTLSEIQMMVGRAKEFEIQKQP